MQRITIKFPRTAPQIGLILREVTRSSGILLDYSTDKDSGALVENDEFNCWFYIKGEANLIYIKCEVGQTSFLFWALISALHRLGGEYPGTIPDYADKKWEDIAVTHSEFKHRVSN